MVSPPARIGQLCYLAACFLVGCGGTSSGAGGHDQETLSPSPSAGVRVPTEAAQAVAQAQADASARTGVAATAWVVIEVTQVDWPDSSLGCPQPGMMYTQVVTPGYLIKLRSGSRTLEYHSGPREVVFCRG